jgi:hypothetical protein
LSSKQQIPFEDDRKKSKGKCRSPARMTEGKTRANADSLRE